MESTGKDSEKRYQLRQVADMYWLVNMGQTGSVYERPLALNEAGATIWKMIQEGAEAEEIAGALAAAYGISERDALEDVLQFSEQLETGGYITRRMIERAGI